MMCADAEINAEEDGQMVCEQNKDDNEFGESRETQELNLERDRDKSYACGQMVNTGPRIDQNATIRSALQERTMETGLIQWNQ